MGGGGGESGAWAVEEMGPVVYHCQCIPVCKDPKLLKFQDFCSIAIIKNLSSNLILCVIKTRCLYPLQPWRLPGRGTISDSFFFFWSTMQLVGF